MALSLKAALKLFSVMLWSLCIDSFFFSIGCLWILSEAVTSLWSDKKGPAWQEMSLVLDISSVNMRSSILPLTCVFVVMSWVRPSAVKVSRNVHASLELISLMCMLKYPNIIFFVAVDSKVIRWSVTSSMNILFDIVFFGISGH